MILTVTVNTTLDLTYLIPALTVNKTIRAVQSVYSMGGKPADASYVLGELGIPSLALGLAAGPTGKKVEDMLEARGVTTDFTWVGGDTRINTIIITQSPPSHTTLTTTTMEVEPVHLDALRARYQDALADASVVVLGGTLPRMVPSTYYADLIRLARSRGVPVIFDAAEPNLSVGLEAGPAYIKPNRDELTALLGRPVQSVEEAYQAGRDILSRYGAAPIITFGAEGALAVLPNRAYRIPAVEVEVVSPAGAGDAVLAGLAAAVERGQPIEEGLRLGTAAAAAVCLTLGTADCRREDVERLLPRVQLIPYP